jgi:hypothetical protein
MVQAHRVIQGRTNFLQQLDPSARVNGGTEGDLLKKVCRDVLGAAKSQKRASSPQDAQGMKI